MACRCTLTTCNLFRQKPASGDWTTAKPTPIPSGHCPSDHYEFKGYCFKIMGLSDVEDPSLYRNWTDARMECKALGNGYDLVSIHSDNEQAFLLTILAALDKPDQLYQFWIGLHDWINIGYTYDTFYWSDETSVDYINWAEGEPNNYDYDWADANSGESCVQMVDNRTSLFTYFSASLLAQSLVWAQRLRHRALERLFL